MRGRSCSSCASLAQTQVRRNKAAHANILLLVRIHFHMFDLSDIGKQACQLFPLDLIRTSSQILERSSTDTELTQSGHWGILYGMRNEFSLASSLS